MRYGALLSAMALLAVGVAAQGAGTRVFPVSDKPEVADHYPDRVTHWAKGVTGLADVVYQQLPGYRPQIVDIYLPAGKAKPRPLVLFVHGGGWTAGHTRHSGALADFPAALAELASEGFVVASLEYRLADEARFPAQVQDTRAALRFLKGNAAKYGIDPARVAIWGGSAGGHLSALTALSCGDRSLDARGVSAPAGSECVQAAAIWYGVFDFAALAASRPAGSDPAGARLLGCNPCTVADYAPASPVSYIDAKDPPFLLIHGVDDKTVPVAQSHLAEDRLRAAGVPVTAEYIPGVDHSFIGRTPAETRQATLKAMNLTYDFFHKMLDGGAR
ncbi:MAG: alpha/beta hydrolase [Sphingomonadales bacterium]|nr:alpha/beta hydrolase [Sphingomonadales bacterium]